jgi:predicted porin
MKTKILGVVASAGLALAGHAHAQTSVSVYGVVDAGVEYLTNAGKDGTSNASVMRLSSGNLSGSRLGFRGEEDLGNGMSALFTLENGFDIDTGNMAQGGRLFGRNAFVGLKTTAGTTTFGRHQTALYDFGLLYDPFGLSSRYSSITHDSAMAGRADNSIKYIGKFGPVKATAFYSFGRNLDGEVAGNPKVSRNFGVGLDYAAGPFGIGLAMDQYHGNTIATQDRTARRVALGATYQIGDAKLFAAYRDLKDEIVAVGTPNIETQFYWAGASYRLTPAIVLTGAVYKTNNKNSAADPHNFVFSADYAFSKRTDAYATVGHVTNKGGSNVGLNGVGSAIVAGESQAGLVVGIRHRF